MKKAVLADGLVILQALRCFGFGSGFLGLDGGLLALDVSLAAFFMFGFVVLFSHSALLLSRIAISCAAL
jgi:hypothetical protein